MRATQLNSAIESAIRAYQKLPAEPAPALTSAPISLAALIDHTLLAPQAVAFQYQALCQEAIQHGFYSVCVSGSKIANVAALVAGSKILPIAVIGFPHGTSSSFAKAFEASESVRLGAQEIDMVVAISALKEKDYAAVFDDINQVVQASVGRPVKVILETALLTDEEKIAACVISKKAGAAFVKTSTGYSTGGATVHDIRLMRWTVGPDFGVKASGGIKSKETAMALVLAGANRLGTSSGVAIVSSPGSANPDIALPQGNY